MSEKVDCPQCDGEGGYETGVICGHRCDGCKGCVGYKACELCGGLGEVDGNCAECGDGAVNEICVCEGVIDG